MPTRPPRLVGAERQAMARELAHRYEQGASIRALAREIGRSYGLCQRLLTEAGVQFRARGGANPASPQVRAQQAHRPEGPSHDPAVGPDFPASEQSRGEAREHPRDEKGVIPPDSSESREDPDAPSTSELKSDLKKARKRAKAARRKADKARRKARKIKKNGASKAKRKAAVKKAKRKARKAEKAQRVFEQAESALERARHSGEEPSGGR
ncbi:helix-turn-helix domain-containing protein [Cutibacterium granulosum]|uniref:helix-turn-helix domain-containing protein n=1 Tax=Cutibacterium granulosum TaxID=33011 RepID=UPI0023F8B4B9|nr:helix-turn-helix domain-containing protein [Cutibacterium granulosum]